MFKQDPLPYGFDALEPHIDAKTMEIHHGKHHATYVSNLNSALEHHADFKEKSIDEVLKNINSVPEAVRTAVRNNGGGHWNHTFFWQIMGPNAGGEPTGEIKQAIDAAFDSFANLKTKFADAAQKRFGSGWVWVTADKSGKLELSSSPNQDNPLIEGSDKHPVFGIDVWEHAYYLKYQNKRPDYVAAWWNTVNWAKVNEFFAKAKG